MPANYFAALRKFASATLMFILLFNWFGYRFVADYMQKKSDSVLEARLDENLYDESQLVELKIPINLPYQLSWASYERYNGEIEIEGELYKYVKRKVNNDTLYLMCIPNHQKMFLQTAKNDFFEDVNDLPQSTSQQSDNSKSSLFKKTLSDYDDHSLAFNSTLKYNLLHNSNPVYLVKNLPFLPHTSVEQPPDRA